MAELQSWLWFGVWMCLLYMAASNLSRRDMKKAAGTPASTKEPMGFHLRPKKPPINPLMVVMVAKHLDEHWLAPTEDGYTCSCGQWHARTDDLKHKGTMAFSTHVAQATLEHLRDGK